MTLDTRRILLALDVSLQNRESHWKNVQADDYQISTPVMVALREVREAIADALSLEDIEPRIEEPPPSETSIANPPRDVYNPQTKL